KCWTPSECSRADPSIGGWLLPLHASLGPPSSFEPKPTPPCRRVCTRPRFHFINEARIWDSPHLSHQSLPGGWQNLVVLTEEFYQEILEHPIPTDLEAAKAEWSKNSSNTMPSAMRMQCLNKDRYSPWIRRLRRPTTSDQNRSCKTTLSIPNTKI